MIDVIILHTGACLTAIWGIAHLFPTKSAVQGFGDITPDNKRIITMEWIMEGVSLIFVGVLVSTVTIIDHSSPVATGVYLVTAFALFTFAVVSLFTGFKVNLTPFRLCPFIFGASAALILTGAFN